MKNFAVWIGIVILAFSIFMFVSAQKFQYYGEYGPGSGLFPSWLSGALAIFSILFIFDSLKKENSISFASVMPKGKTLKRIITVILSIILFIIISPIVGYVVTSIAIMLILLLPDFKWPVSLTVATSVSLVLFCIFKIFLDIPLPTNMWGF